jgi:hypothetical protein
MLTVHIQNQYQIQTPFRSFGGKVRAEITSPFCIASGKFFKQLTKHKIGQEHHALQEY